MFDVHKMVMVIWVLIDEAAKEIKFYGLIWTLIFFNFDLKEYNFFYKIE